jgi:hypothetical protein
VSAHAVQPAIGADRLRRPFIFTLKIRQMPRSTEDLAEEAEHATEMLQGKAVARIARHRETEVLIEFADGTRLFVDRSETGVELSITKGPK